MVKRFNYLIFLILFNFPAVSFSQINETEINNFINKWKYLWETKDIYSIDVLLSNDYEYYGKNSEKYNKSERYNIIKNIFKDNDKISFKIDNIKIDPSSSTDKDVKVIFNQEISSSKYNNNSLVTFRIYKGKETRNAWKIYREFHDTTTTAIKDSKDGGIMDNICLLPIILIIAIPVIVVLIFFIERYFKSKCPKCERAFAKISMGNKAIDSKGGYSTVTRTDKIENPNNPSDYRNVYRKEQIHVIRTTYENYWRCKYCDHKWTTLSSKVREG